MKVFTHIEQFDPSKGSLFNWMYTIIRHATLSSIKNKSMEPYQELKQDELEHLQINPFRQLEWKDIFLYLDKLPESTRLVCSLFYLDACSIREISSAINMKEGTVKWHLNECRNRLRTIFDHQLRTEKSA